jgi:hypothetical protein
VHPVLVPCRYVFFFNYSHTHTLSNQVYLFYTIASIQVRRMAESRDQAASKAKNAALVESFAANAAAKAAAARAEEAAAAQRRENAAFVTAPGGGSKLPPPPPGSGDGEGVMGMEEDYVPGPDQVRNIIE